MKMKQNAKTLLTGLAAAGLVLGLASGAGALTGTCDTCHTMHNSLAGAAVVAAGPQAQLLNVAGCGGCHADGVANTGLVGSTPKVDDQTTPLAGGYFDTTNTAVPWSKEHNVIDLGFSTDTTANGGQFATDTTIPGTSNVLGGQLSCSGTNGCHVAGGHHTNVGGTLNGATATTTGQSYRFLKGWNGGSYISGIEDDDWEHETATDHNTYYGANVAKGTAVTDANTISALCASCHSNFHSGTNIANNGSWIRHPTDFALGSATGTEYSYNNGGSYNATVPVAKSDLATPFAADVVEADAIVACVSCHRAHGSANTDLLRWDYSGMIAGTTGVTAGTGCFVCHTAKDGV